MLQPLHQLDPQLRIIDPSVFHYLHHPRYLRITILMRPTVPLHRPQRVLQRLVCIGGVAELQVLVVAEHEAGRVLREREVEVRPLEIRLPRRPRAFAHVFLVPGTRRRFSLWGGPVDRP